MFAHHRRITSLYILGTLGVVFLVAGLLLLTSSPATAQEEQDPSFHPAFILRDAEGVNVLESGAPASTIRTCGECHDTAFIASHSSHADAGFSAAVAAGDVAGGRAWETSDGLYGGWNPITYSVASPDDWIQSYGARHVGGGPVADQVEMNCFLCHTAAPNNQARIGALGDADYAWASSATLIGTGIVEQSGQTWRWLPEAFNEDGSVREDLILVQDPSDQNCGQCHGLVHSDAQTPLAAAVGDETQWNTLTTGQIFSPQRMSNSGLNLADKTELSRSFDVHAERVVNCVDCHYALNNPVFETEAPITRPEHLNFDPRRMDFGDYLYRPLHEFANTDAETTTNFGSSERTCVNCHDAGSTHTWLPYTERHINALACETCHVPELYGPAVESVDWTALLPDGQPVVTYRGVVQDNGNTLLTGFTPVLLPAGMEDDNKLTPYNLVSAWYWVYGEPGRPVTIDDLREVWLDGSTYAPEIVTAFDANGDGALDTSELALDSDTKVTLIAERLAASGLENPRITGEVQPYAIHHDVTQGEWATRECHTCHGEDSRVNAPIVLSSYVPGGAEPTVIGSDGVMSGTFARRDDGSLYYQPMSSAPPVNLYVLGHDAVGWIDLLGMLLFLGVFAGVIIHGGLRYLAARRAVVHQPAAVRQVYMYSIYERQWHWLQTVAIFGLLFTGLVIHRPNQFSMFDFRGVVLIHNALALLLVINAALSLFYHLVSGEIRQYLPRPYGFFDQMIVQAKYYLGGIFRSEAHPFDKTPERKLNPLQQLTYFGILNVLLPLQVITGALLWGAQRLPGLTEQLGGLPFLAPFHTLIAWLFASFIVMHVYLTTTGHTPMANIKAMMLGWDQVEEHVGSEPSIGEEGMAT